MTKAALLVFQCSALQLPAPVLEHRFHATRRWRFDLAWTAQKIAVEIDGGGWVNGRHSRGAGIEKDSEKFNEAILLGWRVFRCSPRQVKSGQMAQWLAQALYPLLTQERR